MNQKILNQIILRALQEDKAFRDVTTLSLIPKGHKICATIVVKEKGIVCGLAIAKKIFKKLDPRLHIKMHVREGEKVHPGEAIISLRGNSRAILSAERTALNFIGYLSGIATLTNKFVEATKPYHVKIMDTRKTTPGLRVLEKMAVKTGGGHNHRFHLQEMILIKDNHRSVYKQIMSLPETIKLIQRRVPLPVEVEVDTLAQFKTILPTQPDIILLDNMSPRQIKAAIQLRDKTHSKSLLEASGGIRLDNVRQIARTGVDRISVGALTHSAPALDFSMEFKE